MAFEQWCPRRSHGRVSVSYSRVCTSKSTHPRHFLSFSRFVVLAFSMFAFHSSSFICLWTDVCHLFMCASALGDFLGFHCFRSFLSLANLCRYSGLLLTLSSLRFIASLTSSLSGHFLHCCSHAYSLHSSSLSSSFASSSLLSPLSTCDSCSFLLLFFLAPTGGP